MRADQKRRASVAQRKTLDAVPECTPDMDDVLRCWRRLESTRRTEWLVVPGAIVEKTVGPIPWDALDAWARRHQYDARAFRVLEDAIEYMDLKFLERQASERRTKTPPRK